MEASLPTPPPAKGNWWTRNWKWLVPTGCLTVLVFFAALVSLIVVVVFGAMKSTDVYREAVARAKVAPAAIEALGSPIKEGMFLSGGTNVNGASGEANLAIPISGPKGSATLYVAATKSVGVWNYSSLVLEMRGTKKRIDLLHEKK